MAEVASSLATAEPQTETPKSPLSPVSGVLDPLPSPSPPFASNADRPSRPLSEISNNSERRRSIAASVRDKSDGKERTSRPASRPVSEIRDGENVLGSGSPPFLSNPKRVPSTGGLQTLTVNLVEYARLQGSASAPPTTSSKDISERTTSKGKQHDALAKDASVLRIPGVAPAPPSPTTKPSLSQDDSVNVASTSIPVRKLSGKEDGQNLPNAPPKSATEPGFSGLYAGKRASLRPSPRPKALDADPSDPKVSSDSPRTSSEITALPLKPFAKAKPKWLRRASAAPASRSKSKSPVGDLIESSGSAMTASASLPPVLPPRKGKGGIALVASESAKPGSMLPPRLPSQGSSAALSSLEPSRSRLAEGQGKPAHSNVPPPIPSRDNLNFRNRLAAWGGGVSRSESSSSIASNATNPQRPGNSAQRVLGHAGSAVSKGWAGLRARGVAGSISGMSSFAQSAKRSAMEPSSSWSSGLVRKGSRDRFRDPEVELSLPAGDGPVFQQGVIKRVCGDRTGRVFGREILDAGRAWGVANVSDYEGNERETRRRGCLPALVVRAVEYLEIWGPKEEGIFRISGRTSHITRLRKEFDSGADLDLRQCHPGDLDPHAVSGLFKSYLRELPSPILTNALMAKFDAVVQPKPQSTENANGEAETLPSLLSQLPSPHWFLLADIVKLLVLIPQHTATNRMTLNALMLSLGPSLSISGPVLTELLTNHESLFATPPPMSGLETASAIDFGDLEVAPPTIEAKSDESAKASDQVSISSASQSSKRRTPRLPKKPSLTRLFSATSGDLSKPPSVETLSSSFVDVPPPRVDVPVGEPLSPLPTFEEIKPDAAETDEREKTEDLVDLEEKDATREPLVAPVRPPTTPTPIADRFSNNASTFPSLRALKSSNGSDASPSGPSPLNTPPQVGSASVPTTPNMNPATVIRRGAPVFFQSTGAVDRSRSRSASVTPNQGGTKRKEELTSSPEGSKTESSRIKRLSAGPGPLNVKEVIRSMEMTA